MLVQCYSYFLMLVLLSFINVSHNSFLAVKLCYVSPVFWTDSLHRLTKSMQPFTIRLNSSLDPLILHGEGSYNLNVVKDMKVTDSFMGLPISAKQCQNKEAYLDCKTNKYLHALVDTCNCLPFGLTYFNDSNISICNSTQMTCTQKAKNLESKCLIRCEGLVVTSYSHQNKSNVLDKMVNIIESYKKFKAIIDLPSKEK